MIRTLYRIIRTKFDYILIEVFRLLCYLCPIKRNRITFINESYSCNPKYICLELLKRNQNYKIWWLSDYNLKELPLEVYKCKKTSFKAIYILSTSKIIIMNSKGDKIRFIKKKNQYVVQTWHGSFPLKLIEQEVENQLPLQYVENSKKDSKITDLFISNYADMTSLFKKSFWYNGEVLECGLPRNDIYFPIFKTDRELIYKKLNIETNKKIVLYAPTFRDNNDVSFYNLDCENIIKTLQQKTHKEWIVLVRLHPNVADSIIPIEYNDNVINASFYVDVQELNLISDILITDYSSIVFDFMLQFKPIFLYVPDEQIYINNCRGIRPLYFKLPFKKAYNNNELNIILNRENLNNSYSNSLYLSLNNKDDGFASKRVVDRLLAELK